MSGVGRLPKVQTLNQFLVEVIPAQQVAIRDNIIKTKIVEEAYLIPVLSDDHDTPPCFQFNKATKSLFVENLRPLF